MPFGTMYKLDLWSSRRNKDGRRVQWSIYITHHTSVDFLIWKVHEMRTLHASVSRDPCIWGSSVKNLGRLNFGWNYSAVSRFHNNYECTLANAISVTDTREIIHSPINGHVYLSNITFTEWNLLWNFINYENVYWTAVQNLYLLYRNFGYLGEWASDNFD